jgi:hypothetical protein
MPLNKDEKREFREVVEVMNRTIARIEAEAGLDYMEHAA